MSKLSTDREILECIFAEYSASFRAFQIGPNADGTRIYVPIDISAIAEKLDNDKHILFGRLYYHLDAKYRYKPDDTTVVHLFSLKVGQNMHCINYPYLAAILSEKREFHKANKVNFWLSVAAVALSLGAIIAQIST